ncbi:glycosyltransferase family 2 protein [Agrobacterium radiobacter]|uniref:glycosyltransferase family 2 protein n=1 Tax=Agrobacterium radiobacter TaxID=362 RepID=UPI00160662EF|nr:glycosyltransferase [Agrobacterium radiobacter]MBB4404777.1 cellulose synthase/poly-beta-1,6-N-acetylglucosamine synthase-like glycosyltransferase [Agrobacterium radiobacter]MBB4451816.1 cellulose synthase/poly-beta-1,6-N-acetylglucosamine synthase-like glycosyltransferase [Agrobacterium radiobacter]
MDYFRQYTRDSFCTTPATRKIAFSRTSDDPLWAASEQDQAEQARFLSSLGFGKPYIEAFEQRALENGSTVEDELLASSLVTADAYFSAFARLLRLPFLPEISPGRVVDLNRLDTQLAEPRLLRLTPLHGTPTLLIVPELARMASLKNMLDQRPRLLDEFAVTTPQAMRNAIWKAGEARRLAETQQRLFNTAPHHSARITLHGQQGFCSGVLVTLLILSLLFYTEAAFAYLHVTLTLLYLFTLLFRLFALVHAPTENDAKTVSPLRQENELPVYTVLVALYREEAVVGQLIGALERLDWPRSRLDIKLVCEADDDATIEAIRRINPGPHIEVVRVPPSLPRTKPKALTYALSGARGAFVVVYDAEDRPHPQQLREAYTAFRNEPDEVACLQAPLIISNASSSWLSACFALEYSGLFRCMLPALAAHGLPLPLGGTSNHFRTAVLRRAGAWDPYNVTEDADLGLRLHRLGYRCGVIRRQTLEDAPTSLSVWLNQRTRWYKGWLQSWLVMTRAPFATARDMGWFAYMVFQLLIGGMLLSSLAHPLLFVSLAFMTIAIRENGADLLLTWQGLLFFIDVLNIAGSYTIFVLMGRSRMIAYERRHVGRRWLAMPAYWLKLSVAAWRAVVELKTKPFTWNKTPHAPVVKKTD